MTEIYALGTFRDGDRSWPGIVQDGDVARLHDLLPDAPATLAEVMLAWPAWGDRIDGAVRDNEVSWRPVSGLAVELPFRPENLYGAGANYFRHVVELITDSGAGGHEGKSREERHAFAVEMMTERRNSGKPFVFVATRGAVTGAYNPIEIPYDTEKPDWELELAVVIGKPARRVSRAEALDHVAGYTIANDLTNRDQVYRPDVPQMGMDWMACKNAPGYKILGPYITPARFVPDPQALHIRLALNDQTMQDEGTDDMIFDVARIIEFISSFTRLEPGDVVMTGSPSGNGTHYNRFLRDGDVMHGRIDGLVGEQITPCVLERA